MQLEATSVTKEETGCVPFKLLGIYSFILELGLQSKSKCLITLFSMRSFNIWHRREENASMGTLRELDDCPTYPQERLDHSKLSRRTSFAQQLQEL
jgi:hypothetical protein